MLRCLVFLFQSCSIVLTNPKRQCRLSGCIRAPDKPIHPRGSGRNNVIKLKLPADMHSITASTQHTVKVTGLTRPVAGFFPTRIGAQVTRPDDSRPSYTTSSGHLLMKQADQGTTTGRLVLSDRTGYGPKPFATDTNNILYLRLSFGATLWNNGQKDAAQIQITLPDGYSCKVPDGGALDFSTACLH